MINDINYAFNKKDYFHYFFITIILFIILNKVQFVTYTNIIPVIITGGIVYYLIHKKIINDFSEMERQNNKLKSVNVDKYKFLRKDVSIIDCIVKLNNLSKVNRTKFHKFLNYTNKFFMYYRMFKAKNLRPSDLYKNAYDNSVRAVNTLLSFAVELNHYGYLEDDRNISVEKTMLVNNNLDNCIEIIRKRFSIFLTEMEKKINNDWLKGDINVFSKPIYPDDINHNIESDILFSDKFNIL